MHVMHSAKSHLPFFILAFVLFITGLFIYKDYGFSWDEDSQRRENGLVNYNYIHNNNYQALIEGNEKYHGPAFEIALIYIEKAFNLKSSRDIYLMRHLVNFFVYFISVLFFYFIIYKEFKKRHIAFIGTLFFILTPRIFADAFYNSKDLVFMSFVIINIFTTLWLLRKFNFTSAFINGLVTGIVIDTRVMGVIIPAITFLLICFHFLRNKMERKSILFSTIVWGMFSCIFVYAFWPVLWRDPVHHFIKSITEMSHYHWESYLTFIGGRFDANYIPRMYIPVWMLITIPILFLILFITGAIILKYRFFRKQKITSYDWLNSQIFIIPLLAVIILDSVVYDGWRHMYFIYPSFIFIAMKGYEWIEDCFSTRKNGKLIVTGGTYLYCGYLLFTTIWLHPYENLYFNSFAGNSINTIRKRFEIDYWGLSYKEALDHILKTDTNRLIYYSPAENPGRDNIRLIRDDEKIRVCITVPPEISDYYVTTYRYQHNFGSYDRAVYNITRNGVIASVYDFRADKIDLDKFDVSSGYGESNANVLVDTSNEYAFGKELNLPLHHSHPGWRTYGCAEMMTKADAQIDCRWILQIDSTDGELLHYDANAIEYFLPGKWTNISWRFYIPGDISNSNKIKFYVWNINRNKFEINNLSIRLYSVPDSVYQDFKSKHPVAYYRD
jgi:hypothetical protein